mmetsp:Transcript_2353/g.6037  ORF Transcript_2353/g.6037 Transcript_2353/m.6037 type:complete len:294 (-) Transcript_2353:71-952(-)
MVMMEVVLGEAAQGLRFATVNLVICLSVGPCIGAGVWALAVELVVVMKTVLGEAVWGGAGASACLLLLRQVCREEACQTTLRGCPDRGHERVIPCAAAGLVVHTCMQEVVVFPDSSAPHHVVTTHTFLVQVAGQGQVATRRGTHGPPLLLPSSAVAVAQVTDPLCTIHSICCPYSFPVHLKLRRVLLHLRDRPPRAGRVPSRVLDATAYQGFREVDRGRGDEHGGGEGVAGAGALLQTSCVLPVRHILCVHVFCLLLLRWRLLLEFVRQRRLGRRQCKLLLWPEGCGVLMLGA